MRTIRDKESHEKYCNICIESPNSLFKTLDESSKTILRQTSICKHYKKGDRIYEEGNRPFGLICLITGKAKIVKKGVSGREQIVRMAKPVGFIGYRAFFAEENHIASAEALHCVESICGLNPEPVDYAAIPSCIFTQPEVASVGMTEQQARERGIEYSVGRYSFMASGKAAAAGDRDGMVKLLFDADRKLIGAHLVGASVTEMLAEPALACRLGATARQLARTIHAHPTMNEGIMEAAAAAER